MRRERALEGVSTWRGFTGEKKKEARGPCLGGGHTHHARCTRTRIAHAHTQQNHREWATPSLTSKASAHGECHGGVFPVVVVFIVKGVSVATRGLAIGERENNTAEGLAPHAASPRLLVVVPRLHVMVARWHGHLLVVLQCFCSF